MTPTASATRITAIFLIAAIGTGLLHTDSLADDDWKSATHWGTLKFQGSLAVPLGDNEVEAWNECNVPFLSFLDVYSAITVNTAGGVLASFEYVFIRRIGVEVSFIYLANVVEMEFTAADGDVSIKGAPNFTFPTLGANYHFTPGNMIDLYAGGFIALGVIALGFPAEHIEIAKDVALGINTGLDYYFNKSWSLGANVKYTDFGQVDFSVFPPGFDGLICNNGVVGVGSLNFVTVSLGVGYRFL
jgi:opacity protein-like surface antigen